MNNDYSHKMKKFQTLTLLGESYFMLGNLDKAEQIWSKAESLIDLDLSGVDRINFHSIRAKCYFEAKIFDKALAHLNKTREHLYHQLERGDLNLNVWESMLSTWSYVDGRSIEILLTDRPSKESVEEAMVIAEAAKGRMLSKMMSEFSTNENPYKLSLDYHREALKKIRTWILQQSGRKVISLFADENGLAIFIIKEDGSISGHWIDEVKYRQFLTDNYEPWDSIMSTSTVDPKLWNIVGTLTEFLLDNIGELLWRSDTDLVKGGEDLVIIPHRLFRNLPLSHCKLPGGKRLSDCFERVTIFTSMYDLSVSLERSKIYLPSTNRSALVDPDGSLPFARLEGLLISGITNTKIGPDVTASAIRELLSIQGVVLLSSHGNFNIYNAWQSSINTADGKIELSKLLLDHIKINSDLVVLGVCEVGRSRRTYSDEPIGFPGVLIQAGVPAVVAPMWRVDDFSSLLFLTTFFQLVSKNIHLASALQKTAIWLRQLKAKEVLYIIATFEDQIKTIDQSTDTNNTLKYIKNQLNNMKLWLQTQPSSLCPFRSPLDWASFQITGFVPIKPSITHGDLK
jgi:tetratricopeptide (TPR) repeat protein